MIPSQGVRRRVLSTCSGSERYYSFGISLVTFASRPYKVTYGFLNDAFLPQVLAPLSFSTNALPSPNDGWLHIGQAPVQMSPLCGLPWLHCRFYSHLFIRAMSSPSLYGYNKCTLLSLDFPAYSLLPEGCVSRCAMSCTIFKTDAIPS